MTVLFLGDSITEGVGATSKEKRYTDLIAQRFGCRTVNYGISGTRIGRQKRTSPNTNWDVDFRTRVPLMESEADLVFIFGGTNDYGHGALHLGNPEQPEDNTFCSQLSLLIDDLSAKYGAEKLCFILPLRRFVEHPLACKGESGNELGASLADYVAAMRKILSARGVDYIDLYENGFPKPLVDSGDEYTTDGTHPNDRGYQLVADRVAEYISKKSITDK